MGVPVYVIGSSNTDMVVKAERLPLPGETIIGGTFLMNAGGKGANQAVAAARLGGQVTFVGHVGNDLFGRQTLELLKKESIQTAFVSWDAQYPSGVALINVDAKGENCIVVAPGANGRLTPALLNPFFDTLKAPAWVLVQLEIPVSTVEYVIEQCAFRSIPVILNPAPASKISKDVLKHVHVITPNETEAEWLTGIQLQDDHALPQAAEVFHNLGIEKVIITLGKRGAYWSEKSSRGLINAPTVTAMDTTAAGDCFNGALAVALAEGRPLGEVVSFACKAASVSVTRMGAQASMPTLKEVNEFKNYQQLTPDS
jgi:ribokinase